MSPLLIMASGLSSRFGAGNKLLAPLGGRPMIAACLDVTMAFPERPKFMLCPPEASSAEASSREASKSLRALGEAAGAQILINPHPGQGQGAALAFAVRAIEARGHRSVCVLLGDMPYITKTLITALLQDESEAILCRAGDLVSPPAVFRGAAFLALRGLSGDRGAKSILDPSHIRYCDVDARLLADIDTQDGLDLALEDFA